MKSLNAFIITLICITSTQGEQPDWFASSISGFNGKINAIQIVQDGVIVVGDFTVVNGSVRPYIAKLNNDGALDGSFDTSANGRIFAIEPAAGGLLVGGTFTEIGGKTRNRIALIDTDGGVLDFTLNSNGYISSIKAIYNIESEREEFYIGGGFTSVGGVNRTGLARVFIKEERNDALSAIVDLDWSANVDGSRVNCIELTSDGIIVGGLFNKVKGVSRSNLAKINDDGTVDSWKPNPDGEISLIKSFSSGFSEDMYVVGSYSVISGSVIDGFSNFRNGALNDSFKSPGRVLAMERDSNGRILFGTRSGLLRLDGSGNIDFGFQPVVFGLTDETPARVDIIAIEPSGKILIGGNFSFVGGQLRNGIARLFPDSPRPYIGSLDGPDVFRNLSPIKRRFYILNDGSLKSSVSVRGSRGNPDFGVSYSANSNITSSIIAGRFVTPELGMEEPSFNLFATVKPDKKRLKKRGRIILRRLSLAVSVRPQSPFTKPYDLYGDNNDISIVQLRTR